MSNARNSIKSRIERHARNIGLFATSATALCAALLAFFTGNYENVIYIFFVSIVIAAITWLMISKSTTAIERDVTSMTEKVREYNRGNKSARTWGSNITELRSLSEQINRMAEEGESALSNVHAEDQRESGFISDVSHELRTPLTSIRGAAETLLEGDMEEEDRVRFLNMIISESARLTRLANDLLTLQRIEGGTGEIKLSRFSLGTAVERAKATLDHIIEVRNVYFETYGEPEEVLGDIDRIQQVVVNLVDNASRAVGEDGHVWIEYGIVDKNDLGPLVHEEHLADVEEFAYLSVFDDGPGIPASKRARIFDRFNRQQYSRDRKSGGSGLGLSIVKAIVKSHGGTIDASFGADEVRLPDAHSDAPPPEYGSCFTVYLPIPPTPDFERMSKLGTETGKQPRPSRIRKRIRGSR
ncbi:MAG: HAMP domain-containing histidine kinase [Coriobacteriia bacterium]|nr:HAMP domain-containing histidine kinase [Coriobacteriia bacterium]MCL2745723.1 HAMP domain-containing histidine kinase [Coriobacteriia bacterium]MCL2871079.1 HAMP domain-containing histidine kinase [Coriobacteriia bacterium]